MVLMQNVDCKCNGETIRRTICEIVIGVKPVVSTSHATTGDAFRADSQQI